MRKGVAVGSLAVALAMLAAGVAFGAHSATGTYTGCYSNTDGAVRIIKEAGLPTVCPSGYTKFTFPDAAPTEARLTFFAGTSDATKLGTGDGTTWVDTNGNPHALSMLLDSSNYPKGSTVVLEAGISVEGDGAGCVRVYDFTAQRVVAGSVVCQSGTGPGTADAFRLRSGAFSLPTGLHEYVIQGRSTACTCDPGNPGAFGWNAALVLDW